LLSISLLALLIATFACSNDTNDSNENNSTKAQQRTSNWTEEDVTFHLDYCNKMMSQMQGFDIDANLYCKCFIDTVKYYYTTADVLDAYKQEVDFSKMCLKEQGF